jgi:hypothetical protein
VESGYWGNKGSTLQVDKGKRKFNKYNFSFDHPLFCEVNLENMLEIPIKSLLKLEFKEIKCENPYFHTSN